MRFITPSLHGALDYIAATALIVAPFILGLADQSALAHWMSVIAGAGLIVYSLFTNYKLSLTGAIPFKLHLVFDLAAAATFLAAPWIFGFTGVAKIYYIIMGAGVILVVLFSNTTDN